MSFIEKKIISSNQMTNFSTFYYSVKENYQLKGIVQKMTIWIDNSTHVKKKHYKKTVNMNYHQKNPTECDRVFLNLYGPVLVA